MCKKMLGNYLFNGIPFPTSLPTISPTNAPTTPRPSNPTAAPTAYPTGGPSILVWYGGYQLLYSSGSSGLGVTGNAGYCSGGRGFESSADSYEGVVDANTTFVLRTTYTYPTISVFPSQNSFSTGSCSGRIAVSLGWMGGCGYLYVFGQTTQTYINFCSSLMYGSSYTLRLVQNPSSQTTTGYLYAIGSSIPIATTPPLSESFSSAVKVGVVADDQGGWTSFSAVGVNGMYC